MPRHGSLSAGPTAATAAIRSTHPQLIGDHHALSIATNSASINSQRILSSSQSALNKSMERLTSSMRINRAADDAAGLAITTKQTAQIRSLNQAVRNANDGISIIQTAESGMDAVQNMLTRMKELATQGATDTLSTSERDYLAMEINELRQEINNVANRTTFNGIQLLNGSTSSLVATHRQSSTIAVRLKSAPVLTVLASRKST